MKDVVFLAFFTIFVNFNFVDSVQPGQKNSWGTIENVPRFPKNIIEEGNWEDKFNPEFTNTYYHRTAKYSR